MREFRVITKDGRSRIRSDDLEAMGEPFAPENVYETIRKLKRFSHMRVSRCRLGSSSTIY